MALDGKQFEPIRRKEKIAYGTGDVACNIVFALTTSLLLYFYTNVVHVNVFTVGVIMMISRIFDGISDVLIGFLIDRTKSRHGKARAWILWMMFPYALSAILLFTVPQAAHWVQAIYIFITYNFCTTVVYTALNLPYATLASLITRDVNQRASINLYRTGMSAIGNLVITSVTFPLVSALGDTQQAWVAVSILYALLALLLLWFCFKNCHERVHLPTGQRGGQSIPLLQKLRLILTNRYFILFFLLSIALSLYEAITGSCTAYYAQYILHNRNLTGAFASFEAIPQIIVVLLLSPFIYRFGKRNVAFVGAVIASVGVASQFLDPDNLSLAMLACILRGIGKGCFRGVKYSMLSDIIEYGNWKTGVRLEGMIVSTTTAGQKFGSGITTAAISLLLDLAGFAGEAAIPASAKAMIAYIYIGGNLLAWALIALLLILYRLDKHYPQIMADLAKREAAADLAADDASTTSA
ncbi:MFS transporter [Agathobaculum sp. Marseille-P7918]|uniref:MFS transporter n=1 Tax=Agathobaculum sp. Marseille-P7918 TaxID=2479843 RepID=UPI000F62CE76|nr:glycoside-pentoside-hexuronide (GPH):cation symporter [Agathobaculum sp. Marseille-P7918]